MAEASAAATLGQKPEPIPPAAWSSPAKSRPSQPKPICIVSLHQAASELILIVPNLGFCHLVQRDSEALIAFGSLGLLSSSSRAKQSLYSLVLFLQAS
ncbi:hypothetical protein ACFX15_012101 [Malus domestica]